MKTSQNIDGRTRTQTRAKWLIPALLVVALCCIGVGTVWHTIYTRQNVSSMTYTELPMSHGTDVRRAFVGSEEMNDICVKRLLHENKECARLGIYGEERHKRLFAVQDAGQAEINRVIASHYKEAFDPTVMDRAVRAVSDKS